MSKPDDRASAMTSYNTTHNFEASQPAQPHIDAASLSRSPEIAQATLHCRELTLVCHYDKALSILDTLIERADIHPTDKIELYRAAARTLFARGFPVVAKDCIQKALGCFAEHPVDNIRLPLLVHNAFVTFVGCGDDLNDDGCLSEVETLLASRNAIEDFDIDDVGPSFQISAQS
jgi:hypothetical protein